MSCFMPSRRELRLINRSSHPTSYTSALETTSPQLPAWLHLLLVLLLSCRPLLPYTNSLLLPLSSPGSHVRAPALLADPSLVATLHGSKAPSQTVATRLPLKSLPNLTGRTSTPSSVLSQTTRRAPLPLLVCSVPLKLPLSFNTVSKKSYLLA